MEHFVGRTHGLRTFGFGSRTGQRWKEACAQTIDFEGFVLEKRRRRAERKDRTVLVMILESPLRERKHPIRFG